MFCVKCGNALREGMAFCPNCRNPVPGKKPASQVPSGSTPSANEPKAAHTPPAPPPPQAQGTIVHGAGRPTPKADSLVGTVLANRYRLVESLGKGNMGVVYKAEDMERRQFAAIKVMGAEMARNQEFAARFRREAGLAGKIKHPNAIDTYDSGQTADGLAYIAMEFLDGEPLGVVMKRSGPLPLDRVVRITRQAAAALDAGHQLSIVHRDFKPDNVYICQGADGRDAVKVLDFGVAKQTAVDSEFEALTQAGFVVGTPQYISPEQVLGEPISSRSDLYSLAIVVYQMLTGGLPFSGNSPQKQMFNRVREAPSPIHHVNPDLFLPPEVEDVLMKALSRRPEDRYTSTLEFATELEGAANSEFSLPPQPVAPEPSKPVYPPPAPTPAKQPYPPPAPAKQPYPPAATPAVSRLPSPYDNLPGKQASNAATDTNKNMKIGIALIVIAAVVIIALVIYFVQK